MGLPANNAWQFYPKRTQWDAQGISQYFDTFHPASDSLTPLRLARGSLFFLAFIRLRLTKAREGLINMASTTWRNDADSRYPSG
jgi:hypothetical protein